MIKKFIVLYLLISLISLLSCTKVKYIDKIVDLDTPNNMDKLKYANIEDKKAAAIKGNDTEEELYNKLFSLDHFIDINIDISTEQLELIQNDYNKYSSMGSKSPIYRKCNLCIFVDNEYYEIEEVGIRMKGNTSRKNFYNASIGMYDLIHFKLSFSETFDDENYYDTINKYASSDERKARKNRTFATLEKLDLKYNKTKDSTYVRELFSYELFRNYNLVSPHISLSVLNIMNNNSLDRLGVFMIYEPVDSLFVKREFNIDDSNDLYKVGWGQTKNGSLGGSLTLDTIESIGVEDEDKVYFPIYDLKTNKKKSKHSLLTNFITTINNNDYSRLDIDYFIKFSAITYLLGNPDDLRYHYNNYYIYFDPNDLAIFIPYDYDRCLGCVYEWNPSNNGMTNIDPISLYTTELGSNINPLYINLISANNNYQQKYLDFLSDVSCSDFYSIKKYKTYYNKAYELYNNYTTSTIDKLNFVNPSFSLAEEGDGTGNTLNLSVETFMKLIKKTVNLYK